MCEGVESGCGEERVINTCEQRLYTHTHTHYIAMLQSLLTTPTFLTDQ